jgi:hypothetical protein
MKCPDCQFENREGVKFCENCGNKFEIECPNCKVKIPPDRKFCGECGHNLTQPAVLALKDLSFDEKIVKIQKYGPKDPTEKILSQKDKIEKEKAEEKFTSESFSIRAFKYKRFFGLRSKLYFDSKGKLAKVLLAKNISLPIKKNIKREEVPLCTYNLISKDKKSPSDGIFTVNWYFAGMELLIHHYKDGDIGVKSVKLARDMILNGRYFKKGTDLEYFVLVQKKFPYILCKPKLELQVIKAIKYQEHKFGEEIKKSGTILVFQKSGYFPRRKFDMT